MKRFLVIIGLLTAYTSSSLWCLEINFAPFIMVDLTGEEAQNEFAGFTTDLHRSMGDYDKINCLKLTLLDDECSVETLLDASTLAYDRNIPYILYGTLYREKRWLEARITLYESETDSIKTIFYSKADTDRYDDLITELGEKICRYFYKAYDIQPAQVFNRWKGYWDIGGDAGYWAVLPDWSDSLSGVFAIKASGSLAFKEPFYNYRQFVFYPRLGVSLAYGLGLNKAGYENFSYNSIQIAFPMEVCAQWRDTHSFALGLTLGSQMDFLVQSRLYGETYTAFSQSLFLAAGLTYEYLLEGKPWSLGMTHNLEWAFYKEPMISYKPSIRFRYRFLEEK